MRSSIRVQSKLRAAEIAYDAILAGGIQFPEDENDFVVNGKIVRSMSEDDVRSEGILIIPKKKV